MAAGWHLLNISIPYEIAFVKGAAKDGRQGDGREGDGKIGRGGKGTLVDRDLS